MTERKDGERASDLLNGDRPKERLVEDQLGHVGFARALAASVSRLSASDGFVMAVHGPWGSGKTSAVNMALDALEQTRREGEPSIAIAHFNPWWFSEQEDLTRAFFAEVSAALGSRVSSRVVECLRAIARRAAGARKVVGAAIVMVPGGAGLKDVAEGSLEWLGEVAGGGKSLDALRGELQAALREDGRRILVVIDDVDRLPADEARQIFRLVKSVADLPNVVHLLVFDREIARRAMGSDATTDGPEWLEKIVQASFDVPVPHPMDLLRMFLGRLERVVGSDPEVQPDRWPDVLHRAVAPWLRTPRDVTRLANAMAAAWPVVHDKVDLADFVAVETMRLFEPRVYDVVRRSARDLTGLGTHGDDQSALAASLLDAASGSRRGDARQALALLFPRLDLTWSNHSYDDGFMTGWDGVRRVCSGRRFTSYFTFSLDDDVLDASEREDVRRALGDADDLAARVDGLRTRARRMGGNKADLILDEMSRDEAFVPEDLRVEAVRAMLAVSDRFIPDREERSFGSVPAIWRVGRAINALLGRVTAAERLDLLVAAMATSPSLWTLCGLLRTAAAQHGDEGREPLPADRRLVDDEGLATLRAAFRNRVEREAAAGTGMASNPGLTSILFAWRDIAGEGPVKAWTADLIGTRHGLLTLAERATGSGVGGTMGSYAQLEFPTVDRAALATLVDLDAMVARLEPLREAHGGVSSEVVERFFRGLSHER